MSTATAMPGDIPSESRFARLRARTGKTLRAIPTNVWKATKATGRFIASWAKIGAYVTGYYGAKAVRLVVRGIGGILYGAAWLIKAVIDIVTLAVLAVAFVVLAVTTAVVAVVLAVVYAIALTIGFITKLWDDYVMTSFYYLFRKDRRMTWKNVQVVRAWNSKDTVDRWTNKIGASLAGLFIKKQDGDIVEGHHPSQPQEKVFTIEEAAMGMDRSLYPDLPHISAESQSMFEAANAISLRDKASVRIQADVDDTDQQFPGASLMYTSEDDPYTAEGTQIRSELPLLRRIGDFIDAGNPATEFQFTSYGTIPELRDVITFLVNDSRTLEERAYWTGRLEMVEFFAADKRRLDQHGAYWALIHKKYERQQVSYPVKYVRTGFMDMVEDLTAAKRTTSGRR